MRLKKAQLHELPRREMVKSWTIRLASGVIWLLVSKPNLSAWNQWPWKLVWRVGLCRNTVLVFLFMKYSTEISFKTLRSSPHVFIFSKIILKFSSNRFKNHIARIYSVGIFVLKFPGFQGVEFRNRANFEHQRQGHCLNTECLSIVYDETL